MNKAPPVNRHLKLRLARPSDVTLCFFRETPFFQNSKLSQWIWPWVTRFALMTFFAPKLSRTFRKLPNRFSSPKAYGQQILQCRVDIRKLNNNKIPEIWFCNTSTKGTHGLQWGINLRYAGRHFSIEKFSGHRDACKTRLFLTPNFYSPNFCKFWMDIR